MKSFFDVTFDFLMFRLLGTFTRRKLDNKKLILVELLFSFFRSNLDNERKGKT